MVVQKSKYEDLRKMRVEENKKRMEELNLKSLSLDLKSGTSKKSPLKMKQVKPRIQRVPKEFIPVRRSSRFADKPAVSYKDVVPGFIERPRRSYSSSRHRDLLNRNSASSEERAFAIDKAEEIQSGLESEYPSFIKPMLQSHVTGGFWLGLPSQFCKEYLPSRDEFIMLEDETGDETETKYLAGKTGLSGGWRGFSIAHELVDGDALVFQLVSRTKFKVYILRHHEENSYENEANENKESDNENNQTEEVEEKNLDPTSQKKEQVEEKILDSIGKRTRGRKKRRN